MPKPAAPALNLPAFKLSRLDLDVLFALHRANLAAAQEAQAVLLEAAQAVARLQAGYAEELLDAARGAWASPEAKQPGAVLAEVQAAAEKAAIVVRQSLDLGVAAQRKLAELTTARASANLAGLKTLAA
jgi:hypothetical protein